MVRRAVKRVLNCIFGGARGVDRVTDIDPSAMGMHVPLKGWTAAQCKGGTSWPWYADLAGMSFN